jgi:hypothetical protein
MNKLIRIFTVLALMLPIVAGANPPAELAAKNPGKKMAVVSLSANNFANQLQGWNASLTSDLMSSRLNKMLELTEKSFSEHWTIVPAAKFAKNPEFQKLAGEQREVGLPKFGDVSMPLMSKNRKQLIKAIVDKDKAVALAKVTGADFIVIIYSEWGVATGRFVPTSKALTKNVMSVFDAQGKQVFKGRNDQMGTKTLGGMGNVHVDNDTIDEWVSAYERGLRALYHGKKK